MLVNIILILSFYGQDWQAYLMAKDDIANPPMAEGLNIMNYPVNPPAVKLRDYISEPTKEGVGIGIISVLLS